jgi:hypothetical protein
MRRRDRGGEGSWVGGWVGGFGEGEFILFLSWLVSSRSCPPSGLCVYAIDICFVHRIDLLGIAH